MNMWVLIEKVAMMGVTIATIGLVGMFGWVLMVGLPHAWEFWLAFIKTAPWITSSITLVLIGCVLFLIAYIADTVS